LVSALEISSEGKQVEGWIKYHAKKEKGKRRVDEMRKKPDECLPTGGEKKNLKQTPWGVEKKDEKGAVLT